MLALRNGLNARKNQHSTGIPQMSKISSTRNVNVFSALSEGTKIKVHLFVFLLMYEYIYKLV